MTSTIRAEGVTVPATSVTGNILLRVLPSDKPLCVVLDEVDRVENKAVVADLAELAKNISTYHTNLTIVFVGVAANADELLSGHGSNFRNLRQVSVDRMTDDELRGVIKRGEAVLNISFDRQVTSEILQLCDQFPYYLHLLATNAAKSALLNNRTHVITDDLNAGITQAAEDADQSLRTAYDHAALSVQKSAIYRRILWSMANLPRAAQSVSSITEATNSIAISEGAKTVTVQSVGQALVTLTSDAKNNILTSRTKSFYSFSNPLMKGYVRLVRAKS